MVLSLTFALLANTLVPTFCFTGSSDLSLELGDFSLSWNVFFEPFVEM